MSKVVKGFVIVVIGFTILCIISMIAFGSAMFPESERESQTLVETISTPTTSSQDEYSDIWLDAEFQDTIRREIDNTVPKSVVEIEDVQYYNWTKSVAVIFVKETAWDNEHLRNSFAHATFDTMSVLVNHPDRIDLITIVGKTTMIDSKGNERITKVYQVKTTMEDATTVNWKNLENWPDTMDAINNNFESIWWHQAIRP